MKYRTHPITKAIYTLDDTSRLYNALYDNPNPSPLRALRSRKAEKLSERHYSWLSFFASPLRSPGGYLCNFRLCSQHRATIISAKALVLLHKGGYITKLPATTPWLCFKITPVGQRAIAKWQRRFHQ